MTTRLAVDNDNLPGLVTAARLIRDLDTNYIRGIQAMVERARPFLRPDECDYVTSSIDNLTALKEDLDPLSDEGFVFRQKLFDIFSDVALLCLAKIHIESAAQASGR